MTVSHSTSDGDGGSGVKVAGGGKLILEEVTVDGACRSCEMQ